MDVFTNQLVSHRTRTFPGLLQSLPDQALGCVSALDLATSEHLLVKYVGTQLLRYRFCPKLSAVSARNYFVVPDLRGSLEVFLRQIEP